MSNNKLFRYTCVLVTFLLAFTMIILIASATQNLVTGDSSATTAIPIQTVEQTSTIDNLPVPSSNPSTDKIIFTDQIPSMDEVNPLLPQYDSLTVSERFQQGLSPVNTNNYTYYYGDKVVYLTFDDGPDVTNTPRVLEILNEFHVKATFFVVGTQVQQHPDLLQQVFDQGHAIGNHSFNHNYRQLYASVDSYLEQLQQNDELIKSILHVRPCISRAPGGPVGNFTKIYWEKLRTHGYRDFCWNISSGDAAGLHADQIPPHIQHQLDNQALQSHAIILMHDGTGHEDTVKALPDIIRYLQQQGYEFRVINFFTPPAW